MDLLISVENPDKNAPTRAEFEDFHQLLCQRVQQAYPNANVTSEFLYAKFMHCENTASDIVAIVQT